MTIHWSKDSKKFALERNDDRNVADYWVIHSLTNPRPILETRSYALPGEANMPIGEIDIFDAASKQRVVVEPKSFVDEVLNIADAAQTERDREELLEEQEENRQNPAPLSRLSPKWVADTSEKLYFTIKANKRFEMLVFPGMRHSYMPIQNYVILARGDLFSRWLLGSSDTGADIIELEKEKQATPSKRFKQ